MIFKCPGAQRFREPTPEVIKCPSCNEEVEIWADEVQRRCPKCKNIVMRKQQQSCLDWCRYARQCLGPQLHDKYMQNRTITIRQKLVREMQNYFAEDKKRINHAKKVMHFAQELLKREKGNWHIVISAAALHDIGIKEAERKYGSSAGHYQEKEGPSIARKILLKIGLKKEDIDEICEIIAYHHTPGKINTHNFKILYDSDWLVNIKDEFGLEDKQRLKQIIDNIFMTASARELAKNLYL
jgi:HD superfamily phosphohydrolase YqeK/predicted RNA-binding Zn-ribbon protein involved in translation (DUF1610 family)